MPDPIQDNGPIISKATVDNVPHIKSMVDAAFSKYIDRIGKPPGPMAADYSHIVTTQDAFVLRDSNVVNGSKVVGFISLSLLPDSISTSNTVSVNIDILVVDASAQGKGYGRRLMDYAENEARQKGISCLTVCTNVKMYENIGLYNKLGFVEVGRHNEEGYDRVFFRRDLLGRK
jgi:ribosomal protein S18 acetylase RimI-like enzyme